MTQADGKEIKLPAIFTCPDLRELRSENNYESSRTISGEGALAEIASSESVFLVGPDQCGKSAIAKMLVTHLRSEGMIPVLISGAEVPPGINNFKAFISAKIDAQYGVGVSGEYLNKPLADKVLVIDDYHFVSQRLKREHQLIDFGKRFASKVIFLSHDTEIGPSDFGAFITRPGPRVRVFNIPPLTFERRSKLIEKWVSLSSDFGVDAGVDQGKEAECHRMVNIIVGQNYVQPFPSYILAILQSVESGREIDLSASTHGHLYEVFIKTALSRRRTQTNYNVLTAFIATLAIEAFTSEAEHFTMDFFRRTHSRFERETDLSRDIEILIKDLVEVRLLAKRGDDYEFRERYIYYYFVAFYLKDRLSETTTQHVVRECAAKAWVQDYANVLLFLAHLSKDRFIVETMLESASKTFHDIPPARLEGELSVLLECDNSPLELQDDEETSGESRLGAQESAADESQLAHVPYPMRRDATSEEVGLIGQLSAALKMLQILGQILKNFPANFDPAQKVRIVNECIDLGLRSLGYYFKYAEEEKVGVIREFVVMIKAQIPELTEARAVEKAGSALANLCHLASFGIVKRISYAIGSSELTRTYQKVFSADQSPARSLVHLSMRMDQIRDFPGDDVIRFSKEKASNFFAIRVLRSIVTRHFRLFRRDFKLRQSIGEQIGISYQRTITGSGQKLIGSPTVKSKAS